jgi:hypothetical protein
MNQKRNSQDAAAQARRESFNEMKPPAGFIGKMWNKYVLSICRWLTYDTNTRTVSLQEVVVLAHLQSEILNDVRYKYENSHFAGWRCSRIRTWR